MGGRALAEGKDKEIRELATKYGVERYLGTEKLAIIDALVKTWADGAEDDDPLSRSTTWLESKSEIEDIMAHTALESNSRESMYLLGSSATGQVAFEEVKVAYIDGFNTLMRQYGETVARMTTHQITEIEIMRDRFIVSMPMYGTIEEKRQLTTAATHALQQLENLLSNSTSTARVNEARAILGKKETTRSMLLTQAEAGFKTGDLSPMDYQQIQNLIGRNNSLFQGQITSMKQYGNNVGDIFSEMDRVLNRANTVIGSQEDRYTLSGFGFTTEPRMNDLRQVRARLASTGDGITATRPANKIMQTIPKMVGESVRTGYGNPPWVAVPNSMKPPSEPTVTVNPNANHVKFINPADVHRREPLESKFSAYHIGGHKPLKDPKSVPPELRGASPAVAAKNAGLLGKSAVENLMPGWAFPVIMLGFAFATPGIIRAMRSPSEDKAY
jgi:hypothetical protein